MEGLRTQFEKLAPFIKDPTLFATLEALLAEDKDKKKKQPPSVEQRREQYQRIQTASEILADLEMENIFEREGSLRHPPLRVKKIKQDPCLSEKSPTYPLLKAMEAIDSGVAASIANKMNSIIVGAAIASRSKSENAVYRKKIGTNYDDVKAILSSFKVDAFDTELMAFDLYKLKRFAENQKLEKDLDIDTPKLKAKNDALMALIQSRQDYAVADCEFEADILDKVVVTFSPLKVSTKAALADVMLQDPIKVEKELKSQRPFQTPEFASLTPAMQALARKFLAEQGEGPSNKIVKVPSAFLTFIESLIKKAKPELEFDFGHFIRMGRALYEDEPSGLIVSIDLNGELTSFDGLLDSNAIKLVLGASKYELLRAEVLTKLASLVCSQQTLEAGFKDVSEQTFKVKQQSKGGPRAAIKPVESDKPKILPRVYSLYKKMIDVAQEQPEAMPESATRKERHLIAHRRLLPPGGLPSENAVKEAKSNHYPTSAFPPDLKKRPETKRLRTEEGIGKLFAVTWMEEGATPEEQVQHRIDAEQIMKTALADGKGVDQVIADVLSAHEGAKLRFYTYVAQVDPKHIQGQTRNWLTRFLRI